jgi:hypothetical protein
MGYPNHNIKRDIYNRLAGILFEAWISGPESVCPITLCGGTFCVSRLDSV